MALLVTLTHDAKVFVYVVEEVTNETREQVKDEIVRALRLWNVSPQEHRDEIYQQSEFMRDAAGFMIALTQKGIMPPCGDDPRALVAAGVSPRAIAEIAEEAHRQRIDREIAAGRWRCPLCRAPMRRVGTLGVVCAVVCANACRLDNPPEPRNGP